MRNLVLSITSLAILMVAACSDPGAPVADPRGLEGVPMPDESQLSEPQKTFYEGALRDLLDRGSQLPDAELAAEYGALGKRLLADGFAEAARPCFVNAVRLQPDSFDWLYYLAHVDRGYGRADEAIAGFERALEIRPDDVASWVWLGDTLLQNAAYDRSRAAFEEAIELHEESAAAHLGLGRVALAERRFDDAVAALTRTLELQPGASIAHYPLAQAYRGLGDLDSAQRHLELRGETEAYPYDPLMEEIRTRFGSPTALTDRGGNAFMQGDFVKAVAEFRNVVEIAPNNALSHANLGAALFHQGDLAAAAASFERALELDPADPAILFSLGVLSYHAGNAGAEQRYYEQALQRQSDYVPAHLELAHALRDRGDHSAAVEHYTAVLEAEPRSAVAHLGLTMSLVKLERWAAVRDALLAAAEALPDQPAFAHALARIHASAPDASVRDGRRALELLNQLIQAGQQSTDIGETLAMAMASVGEFEQAIRFQTQAIDIVRQAGQTQLLEPMNARLAAYRASREWFEPWPADDPLHRRPEAAVPAPPRRGGFDS